MGYPDCGTKGEFQVLPGLRLHRRKPAHHRTAVDAKLMERTGFDEVTLWRIRKSLMKRYAELPYQAKVKLLEGGTYPRFNFLNLVLGEGLPLEQWQRWLNYLEHTDQDLGEMGRGEYPISPYIIRIYSALYGIKVDFLLVGHPPTVEPRGVPIDLWPLTGTTR